MVGLGAREKPDVEVKTCSRAEEGITDKTIFASHAGEDAPRAGCSLGKCARCASRCRGRPPRRIQRVMGGAAR